jgi:hypothetical protein
MQVLIATTKKDHSAGAIAEGLTRQGVDVDTIYYESLPELSQQELSTYSYFVLRDPCNAGKDMSHRFWALFKLIGSKKVLDYSTLTEHPEFEDKLYQHRVLCTRVPMLRFWNLPSVEFAEFDYPVVAKKRISSRGKGVFILNSKAELEEFFRSREIKDFFFEEHFPVQKDVRAVAIGGKIIGGVERSVHEKPREGFTGIGVKVTGIHKLSQYEKSIVQTCVDELKTDFCGVDILHGKNKEIKVLECNLSPQFVASEEALKAGIPSLLAEFIVMEAKR